MTPRLHLYELIRSMTRTEVVAFKEHATKRRKNSPVKYLQLFNAIRGMDQYDESVLREKFKGEGFMNNLSHYKAYLYTNILDSLREAHKNDSTKLHAYLEQIIILKDKGFYHHTPSLFKKAFELARQIEDFPNHLKLLELKQEIAISRMPNRGFVDEFSELKAEEQDIRKKYINLSEYRYLLSKILPSGLLEPEEKRKLEEEIMSDPLMQDSGECLSVRAKVLFYSIQNALKKSYAHFPEGKETTQTIIDIYEAHPSLLIIHTELVRYLNACYNLGLINSFEQNPAGMEEITQKLEAFGKKHKRSQILLFERTYLLKIYHAYRTLNTEKGDEIMTVIQDRLKEYSGRIHKKKELEFHYIISVFYLCTDQPKKALRWINQTKNDILPPLRKDLHFFSWTAFLLAHFELGNWDVLERAIPSTKNYFQKFGNLNQFEKTFLDFLHKYIRQKNRADQLEVMKRFKTDLTTLLESPEERRINNMIDIQSWVESKITGKSFFQVLKAVL